MNREQRRKLRECLKSNIRYFSGEIDDLSGNKEFYPLKDGDKVLLNVCKITARKDYCKTQPEYQSFVEQNKGIVFTARLYRKYNDGFSAMVELKEDPRWLFWNGDLIRITDGGQNY